MLPLLLSFAGCLVARPGDPPACNACHGGEETAAPPVALGGPADTTFRGVGAHTTHVLSPAFSAPVACTECHVVPELVDDEGHVDTPWPAEVGWTRAEIASIAAEPWDPESLTCRVYCHGVTLTGGTNVTPLWTGEGEATCGACHGLPPDPPHPPSGPNQCTQCHTGFGDPALHIDGIVQLDVPGTEDGTAGGGESCVVCHGEGDNSAPPLDVLGQSDTSLASVGAHSVHVFGTGIGAPVACTECHVVPELVADPGHIDPSPAEVVLDDGLYVASSCSDTTCHGPAEPDWTVVDGSQAQCGSCHGLPPPPPHPQNDSCESCHPGAGPGPSITDPDRHVDGTVNL